MIGQSEMGKRHRVAPTGRMMSGPGRIGTLLLAATVGVSGAIETARGAQATVAPARSPAPTAQSPANRAPGNLTPPPEEFSTFHHATRDKGGKVTSQIYLTPQFHQVNGRWTTVDASVAAHSDPDLPMSAEGALRPVRFGRSASRIIELELDHGPVQVSSASLAVGQPELSAGGVMHRNVATDTDLKYTVSNGSIKEEVILRSARSPRQYTFHIADPNHQLGAPIQQKDGSVMFDHMIGDGVKLQIPEPIAYPQPTVGHAAARSADHRSAHMAVSPAGDGVDVTTSVDSNWLTGKVFPIVLDPTLTFTDANHSMYAAFGAYVPEICQASCGLVDTWDLGAGNTTVTGGTAEPVRSYYQLGAACPE